ETNDLTIGGIGATVGVSSAAGSAGNIEITAGGSITVSEAISADTGGSIMIDANGTDSDVAINAAVSTDGAGMTVSADDTGSLNASGSLTSSNAGNVIVTSNANVSDGDGNDEIILDAAATINSGTG